MASSESILREWGFDERWEAAAGNIGVDEVVARVVAVDRGSLTLRAAAGEVRGIWRPRRDPSSEADSEPAVGDWCIIRPPEGDGLAVAHSILPRRTHLTRKAAGRTAASQVLAANIDVVALVCGLDRDQGIRSIERLMTLVLDGGAMPLIVLTKADLCDELDHYRQLARMSAPGFEPVAVSAATGAGLEQLDPWLTPASSIALLGPSGVGKSTLLNALSGSEVAKTSAVREGDRRGRHTTVRRQLYRLPNGALVVDTPGLRELAAWVDGDGLQQAFADVERLALNCRFRDCRHEDEPGCAVRRAMEEGELEPRRFWRYLELSQEAEANRRRRDVRHRSNSKRRFKDISQEVRRMKRNHGSK